MVSLGLLDQCESALTCGDCSKSTLCVWCESNSSCIFGDINGPLTEYCEKWHYRTCNCMYRESSPPPFPSCLLPAHVDWLLLCSSWPFFLLSRLPFPPFINTLRVLVHMLASIPTPCSGLYRPNSPKDFFFFDLLPCEYQLLVRPSHQTASILHQFGPCTGIPVSLFLTDPNSNFDRCTEVPVSLFLTGFFFSYWIQSCWLLICCNLLLFSSFECNFDYY